MSAGRAFRFRGKDTHIHSRGRDHLEVGGGQGRWFQRTVRARAAICIIRPGSPSGAFHGSAVLPCASLRIALPSGARFGSCWLADASGWIRRRHRVPDRRTANICPRGSDRPCQWQPGIAPLICTLHPPFVGPSGEARQIRPRLHPGSSCRSDPSCLRCLTRSSARTRPALSICGTSLISSGTARPYHDEAPEPSVGNFRNRSWRRRRRERGRCCRASENRAGANPG